MARAPQAVGADFDQPFGQNVPEEAADKFFGSEGDVLDLLRAVVPVTESDLSVFKGFEAAVSDGDAKDVAAQIVERLFSRTGMPAVDHPLLFPNRGWNLAQ